MKRPKIFISYSSKDRTTAEVLHNDLAAHGFDVWRDQESLYGGQQWPKAIGEAIAAADFFLLLWSGNSAASHFVEFEWTTAVALRKPIIPYLTDNVALPSSLKAVHGIRMKNIEIAMPKLLEALGTAIPEISMIPGQVNDVLTKLGQIQATEPAAVVDEAKTVFIQQGWTVQGNVYQASGDIFVTVQQPSEEKPKSKIDRWVKVAGLIATILTIVISLFALSDSFKEIFFSEKPPASTTPLRGIVKNMEGEPVDGAKLSVDELPGETTVTTSDGGFYFSKVPGNPGDRIRIFVSKPGFRAHNEYVALPGPVRIQIDKQ